MILWAVAITIFSPSLSCSSPDERKSTVLVANRKFLFMRAISVGIAMVVFKLDADSATSIAELAT